MVALTLAAAMCLSVFAGLESISRLALNVAVRSEAHRLLQEGAEKLEAADYSNFVASANETITSSVKTSFGASTAAKFDLTTDNAVGRVSFVRRVTQVASTSSTRTLRVKVSWTWQNKSSEISTLLFRSQ